MYIFFSCIKTVTHRSNTEHWCLLGLIKAASASLSSPLFWSKSVKAISSPSRASRPFFDFQSTFDNRFISRRLMAVIFFYDSSGPAVLHQLSVFTARFLVTYLIQSGQQNKTDGKLSKSSWAPDPLPPITPLKPTPTPERQQWHNVSQSGEQQWHVKSRHYYGSHDVSEAAVLW